MTACYRQTDFRLRSWSVPDPRLYLPCEVAHGVWHGRHNASMRGLASLRSSTRLGRYVSLLQFRQTVVHRLTGASGVLGLGLVLPGWVLAWLALLVRNEEDDFR